DYANKAIQSAQDEVRFNPSDLGGWQRWANGGLGLLAGQQAENGEITRAIATLSSLATLEKDPRLPASLGPLIWYVWIPLPILQAQVGDSAGARSSLQHFKHDVDELIAQSAPDNPRRQLLAGADL